MSDAKLDWWIGNKGPNPAFVKVYDRETGKQIWMEMIPPYAGVNLGWDPFSRTPVVVRVSDQIKDEPLE